LREVGELGRKLAKFSAEDGEGGHGVKAHGSMRREGQKLRKNEECPHEWGPAQRAPRPKRLRYGGCSEMGLGSFGTVAARRRSML
jgi:hypothetical protein